MKIFEILKTLSIIILMVSLVIIIIYMFVFLFNFNIDNIKKEKMNNCHIIIDNFDHIEEFDANVTILKRSDDW